MQLAQIGGPFKVKIRGLFILLDEFKRKRSFAALTRPQKRNGGIFLQEAVNAGINAPLDVFLHIESIAFNMQEYNYFVF
jgi:hypothetical protein